MTLLALPRPIRMATLHNLIESLLAFVLLISNTGFAQVYDFKSYTVREGLLSNAITCLCQDSHGYLWIGTGDGISVYDGLTFRNFTRADGLSSTLVNCIHEDINNPGVMWIGTNGAGLDRFDGKHFTNVKLPGSDWANRINTITQDRFGTLYCMTDRGVYVVKRTTVRFTVDQLTDGNYEQVICSGDSLFAFDAKGV